MKNKESGKLIKAAIDPMSRKEGYGPLFRDKTGEVRMMCCGLTATIIAYRSSEDLDVQFEDGNIVTNKTYMSFSQGYIKHPDDEISGFNRYKQSFKNERIGETKIMNNGMRATIINYDGRYNVDIQYEDGVIIKGICYSSWVKGETKHPAVKTPHKPRVSEEDLKGKTNVMSNGMRATIIAAKNVKDIDIQFEDGNIVEHATYSAFKSGHICHPDKKGNRLGEIRMMSNGMECTIIAYRSSRDIDVKFEDGTEVFNRSYISFQKGSIRNPNVVNKKENRKK